MILSILSRLEAVTGRLEKEAILKQNADNMTLMRTFQMALDPKINFYIRKVPEPGPNPDPSWHWNLYDAYASMEIWLAGRKVRGLEATAWLARLLGTLTPDDQEVIRRVIGRNLKCGVSEATAQKIWPEHLKLSYPCMLVSPLDSKTKLKWPMMAQTKMDGMRFNALVQNGQVSYRSRAGKELDLFGVLDADVMKLTAEENFVLDGELLMAGPDGKPMDRKTGNGLLTKFQKGTGTAELAKQIRAVVWDIVPFWALQEGRCSTGYRERYLMLHPATQGRIQVAPITIVNSMEEAQTLYRQKLAEGEEGLILKDPKGPWEDKRVKHQVKMKAELEADLRVVGVTPGTGKFQGKIGSLMVETGDREVRCSVGTGLTDEERSLDPSEFMGKIVAVKYNAVITDKKTGERSLFLPVFVEIREDKSVADAL